MAGMPTLSKKTANRLAGMGSAEVSHVDGGPAAWSAAGAPVARKTPPRPQA